MSENTETVKSEESSIFGRCRCCLEYGYMKNMWVEQRSTGEREVYGEMLMDTFSIAWEATSGKAYICEPCIVRLRDAFNFKKELLLTAEQMQEDSDEYEMDENGQGDWSTYKMEEEAPHTETKSAEDESVQETVKSEDEYEQVEYLEEYLEEEEKEVPQAPISPPPQKKKTTRTSRGYKQYTSTDMKKAMEAVLNTNYSVAEAAKTYNVPRKTLTAKLHSLKTGKHGEPVTLPDLIEIQIRAKQVLSQKMYKYLGGDEVHKHKKNIYNIVKWSNATPIQGYQKNGFGCYFCTKTYKFAKELKVHTTSAHKLSLAELHKKHTLQWTIRFDVTNLKCKVCDENVTKIEDFLAHLKKHNKEVYTDIKNQIIPYSFPRNQFVCCVCNELFERFKPLTEHMIDHYRIYDCEECGRGFISMKHLTKHEKRHQDGEYKCSYCGKKFSNRDFTLTHERLMHKRSDLRVKYPVKNFECKICDKKFASNVKLKEHNSKMHLKEERFVCEICGKGYYLKSDLLDHIVLHNKDKVFKCELCPKAYARRKGLVEHLRIHANDRRFRCEHCGAKFFKSATLKNHVAAIHGEYCATSASLNYDRYVEFFTDSLQSAVKQEVQDKQYYFVEEVKKILSFTTAVPFKTKASRYYCALCYINIESFDHPSELRTHTSIHEDEMVNEMDRILRPQFQNEILRVDIRDFHCKDCAEPIKSWNDMFIHLSEVHETELDEVYTRLIPYNLTSNSKVYCALCGAEFPNFQYLDAHMNAHYCNYMCSECGDTFVTEIRLKHHEMIHNTGKYPCKHCGKVFSLEKYKKKHEAMVHGEFKMFKCIDCGEQFLKEYERHLHIVEQHPSRVRISTCEVCGKTFDWRPYYLAHLRKAHSKVKKNVCRYCGKRFVTKHEVKTHEMRHTGDGRFLCMFCGKNFVTSIELKKHSARHMKEAESMKASMSHQQQGN